MADTESKGQAAVASYFSQGGLNLALSAGLPKTETNDDKITVIGSGGSSSTAAEAKSIISQVEEGFDKIHKSNSIAEAKALPATQAVQEADTKDIIDEANAEAQSILQSADADLDDVTDVYEDTAEEISAVNVAHDADVATISKQAAIAAIGNDKVKDDLVSDLEDAADDGIDLGDLVDQASLPFDVDTEMDPENVIDRIEFRQGDDVEAIKSDEEFDVFIAKILAQFEA